MRVVVIGLGVTGDAVVRHCRARGDEVTVIEESPHVDDLGRARISVAEREGAVVLRRPVPTDLERSVARAELLVPSPGVPERHPAIAAARAAGVPVRAEVDLAAEEIARAGHVLVAVTGTNGKTTVTTLIGGMLEASGIPALAAGNIGPALLDAVDGDHSVIVAEVSSFQLAFVTEAFRPRVAVLLNVAPDHLDWHGSFGAYAAAKARLFSNQRAGDVLVYNSDDPTVRDLAASAPARRITFSATSRVDGYHIANGALVDAGGRALAEERDLVFAAPHDRANALAAAAAALESGGSPDGVRSTLREFRRLPHRMVRVGDAGGVAYYDDSKATNPHAAFSAVEGFDAPVVLLAGGRNKGLDLGVLRPLASRLRGVVAIGEAAGEVEAAFAGAVPVTRAESMHEAVTSAAHRAQPGDVVLLSPACASFDWYPSYGARGDDFAREVARLVEQGVA